MKYLCLVYGEEKDMQAMTDDACMAYDEGLRNKRKWVASEALQPASTARIVRVRDGKVSVKDGPFAETKELLAGFYLIDATNMDEAIQLAAQIPPASVGTIEVRPVRELTSTTGQGRQL
ncbi:MAG TPA: YciI family protein [Candidatus Acidoferrum sp.]|nr:YciI family protein [Candidatus Acidoferrum sp.]